MRNYKLFALVAAMLFSLASCDPVFAVTKTPAKDITTNAAAFTKNLSIADTDVQKALATIDQLGVAGPQGPKGEDSTVPGPQGPSGDPGPNLVGSATATDLTGILMGTGSSVTTAQASIDYVIPSDLSSYLQDAPSDGSTYGRKDGAWETVLVTESDPVFEAWKLATPPVYSENDPSFNAWLLATPPLYSYVETDSLSRKRAVSVTIDGAGIVPVVGTMTYVRVPYSGTINSWYIASDVSGSCVLGIWKKVTFPPLEANTIAGSEKPTLSSDQTNNDTNLTTWNTAITAGDWIAVKVESASTLTKIMLSIDITAST